MKYRGKYARHKQQSKRLIILLIALFAVGCVFCAYILFSDGLNLSKADSSMETVVGSNVSLQESQSATNPQPSLQTEPLITVPTEPVVYTASVGAMGDLLMHKPLFDSAYSAEVYQNGSYNFDSIFKYMQDDISSLDYAVVNLETTLCGLDNGYGYSGYPSFNCPDGIVDGAKTAGFDMLLTANNHSYDTGITGYKRTVSVIVEKGLETLGTYAIPDETKWTVQNVNNLNIGMLCYTYATSATDGRPALNGGHPIKEAGLCNYFTYDNLEGFYAEVEGYLTEMEEAGADATMIFIHWGEEYQLTANPTQQKIAQKLCDLGVDVIVGGHPHVVQPIELLESTEDSDHKTICLYSTGNAVSNQRQGALSAISTAHTEDGILFSVTFEKQEEEEARISGVKVLPTWVNMFTNDNGRREYNIIPLNRDTVDSWQEDFNLTDTAYKQAKASFDRTMSIVGAGLLTVQEYLNG